MATIALFLSSCFDLKENIEMHKDGSGAYNMTLDLSQIASYSKSIQPDVEGSESIDSFDIGIMNQLKERALEFSHVKGISNVTYNRIGGSSQYSVSFDFVNVTALNMALKDKNSTSNKFDWAKNSFTWNNPGFEVMESSDSTNAIESSMAATLMESATYTFRLTVPKKYKKISSKSVTKQGTTAQFSTNFGEIIKTDGKHKVTYTYK